MTRWQATQPLLQGVGATIIFLWVLLSFMPAIAMLYGDDPNYWIESLFLLIGALPMLGAWCAVLFIATSATRKSMGENLKQKSGLLAVYAAIWITLYPLIR